MSEPRVIKRYANRKLYDTQRSRYVTLDQIADMIRTGQDVKIVDNNSKEDLTSITLAQIIFEQEKKQRTFLPLGAMKDIIQSGGASLSELASQAGAQVKERMRQVFHRGDDGDAHAPGPTRRATGCCASSWSGRSSPSKNGRSASTSASRRWWRRWRRGRRWSARSASCRSGSRSSRRGSPTASIARRSRSAGQPAKPPPDPTSLPRTRTRRRR